MNDFDKTRDLFSLFGIAYEIKHDYNKPGDHVVLLNVGNFKIVGHTGFTTEFRFAQDYTFVEVFIAE